MTRYWRRLRGAYYGWWVLAASVVSVALAAGLSFWSFGLYIDPLEREFGWSRWAISGGFSIALLMGAFASPLIGRGVDRFGPRRVVFVGALLTAASFLLLATTTELWQWFVYQAITAVFRNMMFFIPFQTLVVRWFDRRRGLAVGILGTGFSMGGFVVVPLLRAVIDAVQWEGSFVVSAILIAGVVAPLSLLLIRDHPSEKGQQVDGDAQPESGPRGPAVLTGLTDRQALRKPLFWVIALALMMFFFGMFGWTAHAVPYYESVGYSKWWAAQLLAIAAGSGIITRLVFGYVADRIPRIEVAAMVLSGFLMLAFVALLMTGGSVLGVVIFLGFWFVGSSGGPMVEPLLTSRTFGMAYFASILGALGLVSQSGQIVSPIIAGAIFDATGEYDWAIFMFSCAIGLSLLLYWLAWKLPRPQLPVVPLVTRAGASGQGAQAAPEGDGPGPA